MSLTVSFIKSASHYKNGIIWRSLGGKFFLCRSCTDFLCDLELNKQKVSQHSWREKPRSQKILLFTESASMHLFPGLQWAKLLPSVELYTWVLGSWIWSQTWPQPSGSSLHGAEGRWEHKKLRVIVLTLGENRVVRPMACNLSDQGLCETDDQRTWWPSVEWGQKWSRVRAHCFEGFV